MRAGKYVSQPGGYRAFVPTPLPPDPPISMDEELTKRLSDADRALGRLDGVTSVLPNPDLFVAMYVRHEAVLSSQIEGTQSSLDDVLQFEVDRHGEYPSDIEEVVNYVAAMNYGLSRLNELPLSLRLLREIHAKLLSGVRGNERDPGEFRRTQNWIGPQGCTLATATFVPPPVHDMHNALDNFERFMHQTSSLPRLIHCGLLHAQFETIHPFLDGNGRVGRLLITFLLCQQEILHRPLLYLSYYLKMHRQDYYRHLDDIRSKGDWEGWLKFFLKGVHDVSREATETARKILNLREELRQTLGAKLGTGALGLIDHLFKQPVVSVRIIERVLDCSYATANKIVKEFEQAGILNETTGWQRNRRYQFSQYLSLFRPPMLDA